MALFQSHAAKGKQTPPTGYVAGAKMVAIFPFTFTEAYESTTDLVEIGILPAGAQLLGATLISGANGATITADVGILSGAAGAKDDSRTMGTEFITAGAAHNASAAATLAACLAIAKADVHRGIGVTMSADVVAATTATLKLVIEYAH